MVSLAPLYLSLQVTGCAMALVTVFGGAVAWWLVFGRGSRRVKAVVEIATTLPLVLPPTVVGYLLLLLLGRGTVWGRWLNDAAHVQLLFTWQSAVLAAAVMASPLFVRVAASALASVDVELLEMARTQGATERDLLVFMVVPLAYRGILAGLTLSFARALGEFGATLLVAGAQTQTLPLVLYSAVQTGDNTASAFYTLLLIVVAFALLGVVAAYQTRIGARRGDSF